MLKVTDLTHFLYVKILHVLSLIIIIIFILHAATLLHSSTCVMYLPSDRRNSAVGLAVSHMAQHACDIFSFLGTSRFAPRTQTAFP